MTIDSTANCRSVAEFVADVVLATYNDTIVDMAVEHMTMVWPTLRGNTGDRLRQLSREGLLFSRWADVGQGAALATAQAKESE